MTRNMFRDVIDPSVTVGGKRGYTVPLSIVAHTVILAALIIIPLLATDSLPAPPTILKFFVVKPTPTPLPARPSPTTTRDARAGTTDVASVNPERAPVVAPQSIEPERIVEPGRQLVGAIEDGTGPFPTGSIVGVAPALLPSSPPAGPLAPIRPGGHIKAPTKIKDVAPTYPPIAQAARIEGFVIIEATIGPDGKVRDAVVLRSIPSLDAAAVDAVRQWEYSPTLLNGTPVPVVITVTVLFRLK